MRLSTLIFAASAAFLVAVQSWAQADPYAPGWDLSVEPSSIQFGSVKYEKGQEVIETHSFSSFQSTIEPGGDATITVQLDSVDTQNDLRNVRMRFLFFETFKFPEAME